MDGECIVWSKVQQRKQQRKETMRNRGTKTQAGVAGGIDSSLVNYTGEGVSRWVYWPQKGTRTQITQAL